MAHTQSRSPVSPVDFQPIPSTFPPLSSTQTAQNQASSTSNGAQTSTSRKESWLPFTLRWYYMTAPILLCLLFGSLLVYLTIHSERNHGLGADNGSSAILFGWRFTPTLVAVLYAQMTVILFEDAKRTEPFARLAKAPAGGASTYGTLLQTPRAWWSIFIDVCFRRKRTGHTSWCLLCAALANVLALLAISPLSSALLTSEEVLVPKSVEFARLVPKLETRLPMNPNRETSYRAMNALFRNVSTSAWLSDTNLTFPYWPAHESAQFGPALKSSFSAWEANTITFESRYDCQEMKLETVRLISKQFSGVYTVQNYGPINGTQPMVEFVLTSGDGCKYEMAVHPAADLASNGGVTWSNATTFLPTSPKVLPVGGRPYKFGVSPTHIYARVNASKKCIGRDIVIINTAWTVPIEKPAAQRSPFIPANQTYERSPYFRMRGLLCESQYFMSNQTLKTTISTNTRQALDTSSEPQAEHQEIPKTMIDVAEFQANMMHDDWKTYIDQNNMFLIPNKLENGMYPGFSGVGPLLATPYQYNVSAMLDDMDLAKQAESIKGRFFMETVREAFDSKTFMDSKTVAGAATMIETRVVVLTEIGITLAVLFFVSAIALILVFWSSRLSIRPLNLRSDPASTIGLGLLINRRSGGLSALKGMHNIPRTELYHALQDDNYFTANDTLLKGDRSAEPRVTIKAKTNWRPHVVRPRTLLALGLLLTSVLVAILTLNAFSARSQLSQLAFIYEADVSKFGLSFSTFAPISIAPTLISIIVGLWWDQLDMTWRILQPFISMSQGPTPIHGGAGLTYRSKSWIGAAIKSGRQRHWVLFMISIGSVVAQVLTVSMSALFERQSHAITQPIKLQQSLEIRQVPLIHEVDFDKGTGETPAMLVVDELYLDTSKNWLYGAGIQQSSNGSQLPWTWDSWSFLPVDLSKISDNPQTQNVPNDGIDEPNVSLAAANVTLQVPAIRARLECSIVEEIANVSSWATLQTLNATKDGIVPESFARYSDTGEAELYGLGDFIFTGTNAHTTILSGPKNALCCQNGTIEDPQQAAIGYWSPVLPPNATRPNGEGAYPYEMLSWPISLTTKWIVGRPIVFQTTDKIGALYFTEVPTMQAAQCKPVIETAEASITVDRHTHQVYSSTFGLAATAAAPNSWSDVFTRHDIAGRQPNGTFSNPTQNLTTSFGILFVEALLGLADRRHTVGVSYTEAWNENAFVVRDDNRGINMDLMTYSMYTMAGKDPEALLNYTTLVEHADRTFQTFFQHFVNSGLSLTKGGYAYQPINDNSMEGLGSSIEENGTAIAEKTYTKLNTDRTINASMTHRIRVLHMNTVATYLSTALLIWLIFTTMIVICVQRRYTRFMHRDVQLIADMLVLIAGSNNLLDLVENKGVELKRNRDIKTMLGWFKDREGQTRWGIEVVGGRSAVSWVDAPKQGFHVDNKKIGRTRKLLAWRP